MPASSMTARSRMPRADGHAPRLTRAEREAGIEQISARRVCALFASMAKERDLRLSGRGECPTHHTKYTDGCDRCFDVAVRLQGQIKLGLECETFAAYKSADAPVRYRRDDEIAKRARRGIPMVDIAQEFNLSYARVNEILHERGVTTRDRGSKRVSAETKDDIVRAIADGATWETVCKKFSVGMNTVNRALRDARERGRKEQERPDGKEDEQDDAVQDE